MKKKMWQRKGLIDYGQHRRILLVGLMLGVLVFLPVILRLYVLMVRDYDFYADLALRNQSRTTLVTADRGNIYDCNMNLLAGSQSAPNIYLNPRELRQSKAPLEEMSQKLGEILGKDSDWIFNKAKNMTRRYEQIGKSVSEETAREVRNYIADTGIRGIHLEPGTRRYYPFGSLAAQVIGFTDASNQGVEGVELAWDSKLRGDRGQVIAAKGNNEMDMPFSYEHYLNSRPGSSLVLTLDATVQSVLENQLKAAMDRYQVKNGAFGLVMNCKTGAILAMTTLGSYDPNHYQQILDPETQQLLQQRKKELENLPRDSTDYQDQKAAYESALQQARLKQWRNRVISDGYEPGSTFKVLTMAAALDCGAIDLNTDFYCRGAEQIPGRAQKLHCWRHQGHGPEKTPQALQNSCNIAFAHIALKLGGQQFYDYVRKFGVTEKTGIDLKGESKGIFFDKSLITDTEKWGTASLTSGSFGQTFKLTALQLVRGIASVVNGGKLLKPFVVAEVLDGEGNAVYVREPQVIRKTISEETSAAMRQLLRSVVTEGTAKNAAVAGYSIGGKTGTSEKIDVFDENGQRVLDKIVSFVGIAPMDDPEYIVLAALDTPSRDCGTYLSGGAMAAPTVGAILSDLLPYLEIPKEEEKNVILPDFSGMSLKDSLKAAKDLQLTVKSIGEGDLVTGQIPGPQMEVPENGEILLYLGEKPTETKITVPDFTGMDREEAGKLAEELGIFLKEQGNPDSGPGIRIFSQSPEPGAEISMGTGITVNYTDASARD